MKKKIENIEQEKNDFSDLVKEINIEEQEEKSKRKKRTKRKLEPFLFFDESIIKIFINFPFQYLAKRYGEFWLLSIEEEKSLSELTNRVISKWLPTWLEKFSDEIALGASILFIVIPRIEQTRRLKNISETVETKDEK